MIEKNRANLARIISVVSGVIEREMEELEKHCKGKEDERETLDILHYLNCKLINIYDVQDCLEKDLTYQEILVLLKD